MRTFTEDYLLALPEHPIEALRRMVADTHSELNRCKLNSERKEVLLTAFAFLSEFVAASNIKLATNFDPAGDVNTMTNTLQAASVELTKLAQQAFSSQQSEIARQRIQTVIELKKGIRVVYEFSDEDHATLQKQIDELRTTISSSKDLTDDHRQRLLGRLERVQQELHKKVSNIDQFWGLIGETTIAVAKFGKAAEPILKNVRAIAETVFKTIDKVENLTYGRPPFLGE